MKSALVPTASSSRRLFSLAAFLASLPLVPAVRATAYTWDGGGSDGNISTAANWSTDVAPAATGDTLTFAGTANLAVTNNSITSLGTSAAAITFDSTAGSFNIGGNTITVGASGTASTFVQQNSANAQTISANINLSGGDRDRSIVFGTGAGSLTLSGNINFSNDWLFTATTAGTLILSGTNTGDGKGTNAITAGTNSMRAMMRNNVAGTQLVLGSDAALGNSGSGDAALGTASLRGVIANQQLNISTTGGDRDLSGSSFAINASNITFNGVNNLKIGNLVTVAGNRDFVVSSTGQVTVANGIFASGDQTARQLFVNLTGTGGMVVDGKLYNTLHSGGITTTVNDSTGTATNGILLKGGTGTLTLNGDSGTTYTGTIQVNAGILKIGHANALGSTTGATILAGGTLDLNGQTIGETLKITAASTLSNSSATAAVISADATLTNNLAVNTTGDITVTRLIGSGATRTVTKTGAGTLTTNGTSHNNLAAWDIQAGTVVFANTSGYGADRGVAINGGTLKLGGSNSDLINNGQSFAVNTGVFDLNGKSEAVASVGGTGGFIRNSLVSTASTLFVGGGVAGTSTDSYAGVIENGSGTLAVTKEGSGTQTFTGANTFTGGATVSAGTLATGSTGTFGAGNVNVVASAVLTFGNNASIIDTATLTFASTSTINLNFTGAETVGSVFNSVTSTALAAGTYDAAGLNIYFGGISAFTGTGSITISAIPEPATYAALAGLGALGLAALRRRR
ncbi:MAG: beta strand repeat-containing protein [Rariglobus sp.]|nr:autotransporter-associated beta strand repeat-containing protein [Rariglobus sp.]